ncbi:MAG: methionine ABC transporter ATP-binding protein [Clostridiales bacterium]|nr:methionine ABC transporter ATP-binding protein [Clostridiales bacterium]
MIDLIDITKKYETPDGEITALDRINLHIEKGEIFGIIGLSGAGKSTLLRCINRLEEPTSGKVVIDGIDMTSLNKSDLRKMRRRIGIIFQHFNLLMNSDVYENIAFPLKITGTHKSEIDKKVNELLTVVELMDKKDVYPSQLSGGQKQRVGIARALANNPDILLCDEATSALDPTTTESILTLLKDINKKFGITVVVVTHEMDVIKKLCDRVAVIENSVIVEQGTVLDLFTNPKAQTSKRFLKNMIAKLPRNMLLDDDNPGEEVLRISFLGENTGKPFISYIIRKFDVDANIIAGNIENIQDMKVGNLIIKLSGKSENIKSAVDYLSSNNVRIEVLKNGNL